MVCNKFPKELLNAPQYTVSNYSLEKSSHSFFLFHLPNYILFMTIIIRRLKQFQLDKHDVISS